MASLLAGEMPQGLDETFREAGASLYPRVPKELQTHCDCPDWANPCKHVAAVCYVMAEALDPDAEVLDTEENGDDSGPHPVYRQAREVAP